MESARIATENDLAEMIEIWLHRLRQLGTLHLDPGLAVSRFEANFRSARPPFGFWVRHDTTVVAWSSLLPAFSHPLKQDTDAEVSLYVSPDGAGDGLGTKLMEFTLHQAASGGIRRVWGFALHENAPAIRMCLKAGMQICGRTRDKTILLAEFPLA